LDNLDLNARMRASRTSTNTDRRIVVGVCYGLPNALLT